MLESAAVLLEAGPDFRPDLFRRDRNGKRPRFPGLVADMDPEDRHRALIGGFDQDRPAGKSVRGGAAVEQQPTVARPPDQAAPGIGRHLERGAAGIARRHHPGFGGLCLLRNPHRARPPAALAGDLQQGPVVRDALEWFEGIIGRRNKVGTDAQMLGIGLVFVAEEKMQRLGRQEAACIAEEQAMGRGERVVLRNENGAAGTGDAVVELADRRPGIFAGRDCRLAG